jgi:NAD(P)-dependent dehydrogenase (short-subunit alcohol dehydrogenase family)
MIKNRLVDYGIANKKALVVGGTKEPGLEVVLQLLKSGCKDYIVGRSNITSKKSLNYFKKIKFNKKVESFIADVSSDLETNELIKKFKNKKINFDIIVYNAGGSAKVKDSLASRNEYKKIWDLNLGAAVALNQFAVPNMRKKKWGRIIHVSSVEAQNFLGYSSYVAAKSAVNGYVKSLARNLARYNIIVSAVCPGPINFKGRYLNIMQKKNKKKWEQYLKNHLPIRRLATYSEITNAILFLCSKLSSYCSGSILNIDGSCH